MEDFELFFKNPSVAAFVGAFSAFLLVSVVDWIRKGNEVAVLRSLVSDTADQARKKIEMVSLNRQYLEDNGTITKAGYIPFKTDHLDTLTIEVLTRLNSNEKQALDVIHFWAKATDDQLDEIAEIANAAIDQFKITGKSNEVELMLDEYRSETALALRNMDIICQSCDAFLSGKSHEVLEAYHVRPDA